ncbi:hypothetical protein JW314_11935 [Enterobacter roggenkampii]|uniref:hypothetical protein n=1 Tax=Enterobacter roggenkampii TaxID=1812935 RepID=UPI001C5B115E|nr:hypothetical protein [Enterobacter roggenkampii]MBW4220667.1 hypothetical protein [Enterobacter roggenkampii]MCK7012782.1 hypothetical protein [Enterobacter roggenkampii]MCK7025640.1 hypothetical protein [Enterobacter roggenkampii]MCK7050232.1 hypothetical protein [Enterobacter roggenkampii]
MFDYSRYYTLTLENGRADKLMALINSQDDIGIYLRAHLLIEQTLESWILCASGNREFFSGFGENINLDFAAKAQLAKNFGMSSELHRFVKKFNHFRNKRSHQIDHSEITSSEIDSLTGLMQQGYPSELPSMRDFRLGVYEGQVRHVCFGDSNTSLRDKLIMLYAMFSMRANFEAECQSVN